jgi:hypothetical protein
MFDFLSGKRMPLIRTGKFYVFIVFMTLAGMRPDIVSAQSYGTSEYEIKAAFLFNFAKFVEWPVRNLEDIDGSFIIGILGKDPFNSALEQTIGDKTVGGAAIEIRRFSKAEDLRFCHILFISGSEKSSLPAILKRLEGRSVLTVSDLPDFARFGGMITFYTENNKVRFMIHIQAAEKAGLKLSAKLLTLAKIFSD